MYACGARALDCLAPHSRLPDARQRFWSEDQTTMCGHDVAEGRDGDHKSLRERSHDRYPEGSIVFFIQHTKVRGRCAPLTNLHLAVPALLGSSTTSQSTYYAPVTQMQAVSPSTCPTDGITRQTANDLHLSTYPPFPQVVHRARSSSWSSCAHTAQPRVASLPAHLLLIVRVEGSQEGRAPGHPRPGCPHTLPTSREAAHTRRRLSVTIPILLILIGATAALTATAGATPTRTMACTNCHAGPDASVLVQTEQVSNDGVNTTYRVTVSNTYAAGEGGVAANHPVGTRRHREAGWRPQVSPGAIPQSAKPGRQPHRRFGLRSVRRHLRGHLPRAGLPRRPSQPDVLASRRRASGGRDLQPHGQVQERARRRLDQTAQSHPNSKKTIDAPKARSSSSFSAQKCEAAASP